MDESDIKAAVLSHLLSEDRITRRSIIANEFVLPRLAVRADLAILADQFIGIEIKSDKDSLKRLESQIIAYKKHFDLVILVVATRHLRALNIREYQDVEIMEIDSYGHIQRLSRPIIKNTVEDPALLGLLTKSERHRFFDRILHNETLKIDSSKSLPNARQAFEAAFSKRFKITSEFFWSGVGRRRKIQTQDLEILSRYKEKRKTASLWKNEQRKRWDDLVSQLGQPSHFGGEIA